MGLNAAERNERDLEALVKRVRKWHAEVLREQPRWGDGRSSTIEFQGGMDGYGDDDEPLFSFAVTETKITDP